MEAVEGFPKGRMPPRKEEEEMLELLDSARHSYTKILEKEHPSCEVTMAKTSHRIGMFLQVNIRIQFNLSVPNAGNFFKIKELCL